jgi:hypothetical protein
MEAITKAFGKLFESPESLFIVLGAVLVALGASGGVTYNSWFPVGNLWAQALLIAAGFIFALVGSFRVRLKPKSSRPYGISITKPKENEHVHITDVEGTIRKQPTDYSLWIFRVFPDGKYAPARKLNPAQGEDKWEAKGIDIGGKPGEHRELRVYLVGRSGEALIRYYQEAAKSHKDAIDKWEASIHPAIVEQKYRWLPAIGEPMKDIDRTWDVKPSARRPHSRWHRQRHHDRVAMARVRVIRIILMAREDGTAVSAPDLFAQAFEWLPLCNYRIRLTPDTSSTVPAGAD